MYLIFAVQLKHGHERRHCVGVEFSLPRAKRTADEFVRHSHYTCITEAGQTVYVVRPPDQGRYDAPPGVRIRPIFPQLPEDD